MACWVCGRPERGYGHLDLRRVRTDPRRLPLRWVFCSRRCQDAFHQLYAARERCDPALIEELLPMTLPLTHAAQRTCLQALAAAAERTGFDVPLSRYSREQALDLIETLIHAYETHLQAQSPMRDVFMDDDIPFEHGHAARMTQTACPLSALV